jgi:low molecular weight protein-tyrosine phosphatase
MTTKVEAGAEPGGDSPSPSVSICFVCLGNICRSPTAEGVMKAVLRRVGLERRVAVESAGTADYHTGSLPDRRSRSAARARGLSLDSRAQQFTARDFARFDYVLAMDEANARDLRAIAPDPVANARVRLFRSFDPASALGAAVPDPYHGGADGFEHVLDLCEAACEGLIEHLRREHRL